MSGVYHAGRELGETFERACCAWLQRVDSEPFTKDERKLGREHFPQLIEVRTVATVVCP